MSRYLFPIFLVLISAGMYVLYIKPLYVDIQRNFAEEAEVNAALVQADSAQAQLDAIKKRYESFPPDANEKLTQLIPEKIDPIRLVIDVSTFLERNGFPSESVALLPGSGGNSEDAPYQVYTTTFTVSASYDTFREFLHALESSLALRDASTVTFDIRANSASSVGSTKPELAIHDYHVEVRSYSLH